jgi:hypothetical protein
MGLRPDACSMHSFWEAWTHQTETLSESKLNDYSIVIGIIHIITNNFI